MSNTARTILTYTSRPSTTSTLNKINYSFMSAYQKHLKVRLIEWRLTYIDFENVVDGILYP